MLKILVGLFLLLTPCAAVAYPVSATVETDPVPHSGDAADDPCVWLHPTNVAQSTIIGTDKLGGIAVYGLDGTEIQYRADGNLNNVDVRYNFPLSGTSIDLVAATNRSNDGIALYRVNPATRQLEDVAARVIPTGISVYGFCLYRSAISGLTYAFVNAAIGSVQQWLLYDNGAGKVDATLVRSFSVGSIVEGCVADDVHARFYIGEENVAIWRYGAEPGDGSTRTQVDAVGGGHLTADIEGLTIYHASNGSGYLIASSQGNGTYSAYQRDGSNAFVATWEIEAGATIDAVSGTDGIDVTNVNLGPLFPSGAFIAQDNANTGANQNFKVIPWDSIAIGAPGGPLTIDTTWNPRSVGANPPTVSLTRHPWISLVTQTSALIAWQTGITATGTVQYGTTASFGNQAAHAGAALNHSVTLNGLLPGTVYYYRILSGLQALTGVDSFRTAPAADEPFRFLAFGDPGRATSEQIQLASRIQSLGGSLGILTGDIIYENGEAANFTPQYFDIYRPTIRHIPFYPCLGNHDVITSNGQPYLDAFYLPSNNPAGTERYYSFDHSNAHFVALSVTAENTTPGSAMLTWLDADLSASTKLWKFVYFHVPMYSNSGGHGGDATIAAALEPILDAHKVDIVFQGHNHYYTRTYPIASGQVVDASQNPNFMHPGGPVYIVTGGAGRALYSISALSSIEAFSKSTFHTTYVDVSGTTLAFKAVERDGTVIDSMSISKDPSTAVTLSSFQAEPDPEGVLLRWQAPGAATGDVAFNVYRAPTPDDLSERLNTEGLLTGRQDYEFLDRTAEPGVNYAYRLGLVEGGAESMSWWVSGSRGGVSGFALGRPRPNPSRGATDIPFTLDRRMPVSIRILDLQGRLVRTIDAGTPGSGAHVLRWDGNDARGKHAAAGVYFALARAGTREARVRLTLIR
ncbi:MAG: phytase [Candidatus Eisenbacteria bacterium]